MYFKEYNLRDSSLLDHLKKECKFFKGKYIIIENFFEIDIDPNNKSFSYYLIISNMYIIKLLAKNLEYDWEIAIDNIEKIEKD